MTTLTEQIPAKEIIEAAAERIAPYAHRTPVMTCKMLNQISGADLYFKCENFQKVGAFKFRGGCNTVLSLTEAEKTKGVATHSSGNHAQAIALAAKLVGIPAYIVMPSTSPQVKKDAVKGYGAKIIECEPTLQAREDTLNEVVERTGATFIHPFNDYRVIAGQATAAKELIEEAPPLDIIMAPVGGGGLLSGTALSTRYYSPRSVVIAAEPEGADDAYQSFQAKRLIPQTQPNTIADGLLTSMGDKTFDIMMKYVSDVITVNDPQIIEAMRLIWQRMKIVIEPSCAVPFAAVLKQKERFEGKKIGIILTGGNVDLGKLPF